MIESPQTPPKRNLMLEKQQRFFVLASVTGAAAIGAVLLLAILVLNRFAGAQQPYQSMILKANVHVETEKIKTVPDDISVGHKGGGAERGRDAGQSHGTRRHGRYDESFHRRPRGGFEH